MSSGVPLNSARRTKSYSASQVVDADGIKTSFATVASAVELDSGDLNGAAISSGVLDLPRTVTITRSSAAGQYSTDPIVVTGKRGSVTVTESLAQATADGNDTIRGTQAFDSITSIAIPANVGTGGAYTIGVQDICGPAGQAFVAVELHADGTLNVQYGEQTGSPTDTIPMLANQHRPIAPSRVLTSPALSAPTNVGLTVYLP